MPRPPAPRTRKRLKSVLDSTTQHPLVVGAKDHFETGRLSYDIGYLKPAKHLLVDLVVSKTGLDKALAFANQLFLSLEANDNRVVIAAHGEQLRRADADERQDPQTNRGFSNLWSPGRCTVVYVGTVAIGLTIIEMSENVEARYVNGEYVRDADYVPKKRGRYGIEHTSTTKRDFPTGRLCLQAYSPYSRADWVQQWRETKDRDLIARIPSIVRELERAAVDLVPLIEEGERQAELERQRWEADHERWLRAEAERRAAKALQESKEDLLQIISSWAESRRLEEFFSDAEKRASALDDGGRRRLTDRLALARELIGSLDPLERFSAWLAPLER